MGLTAGFLRLTDDISRYVEFPGAHAQRRLWS